MDGVHLWGKGGCVVRISQGMRLGVDILRQMSSGRDCCLRFKSCIKGGLHMSLIVVSGCSVSPFSTGGGAISLSGRTDSILVPKSCAPISLQFSSRQRTTLSKCQTKKLKTRKSQRC